MHWVVLGLALDSGGRGLAKMLSALGVVVLLGLLLAVCAPIMLVAVATAGTPVASTAAAGWSAQPASASLLTPAPMAVLPATTGQLAVEIARHYLGVPYVFGGSNPRIGLDCSGLVQLVFHQVGVWLPRTAQQQYEATIGISPADLQPGDLVFFARTYADPRDWITHVGIYIGGDQQINAPTEGQAVSIQPVFGGFWGAHFASAGRVRPA